jgi:hypothetical protein
MKHLRGKIFNKAASGADAGIGHLKKHFLNDPAAAVSLENLNKTSLALNIALPGYFAIGAYNDKRNEGGGIGESFMNAAGEFALGFMSLPLYLGATAIGTAPGLAVDAYDWASQKSRQLQKSSRNVPFQNATFLDSQQTYTMRQAGMNIAKQGRYAAQAAMMGNEAQSVSAAYAGRR